MFIKVVVILLMITVWACHRGLMSLVDYLLEKVVMIGMGVGMLIGIGRMLL